MTQQIVLTLTGQTKIANAIANGTTVTADEIAVGDGNGAVVPVSRNRVTLVNEVYRTAIAAVVTDPGDPTLRGLRYEVPATEGGFVIREIGIFDDDGDLIAHGPFPIFEKPPPSSAFALAIEGVVWIKVTDPDALEVNVSIAAEVPASRVLTAGLGLSGGGSLTADRRFDLDLVELPIIDLVPDDASFPVYRPSGSDAEAKHPRIPIELLDRRWRQRDDLLLWFGQF